MSPVIPGGLGAPESFAGPDGPLSYRRAGAGSPFVLLHSLALGAQMWSTLAGELAGEHELLALDLRGHGGSGWSGADFSIEELTGDVLALLDHLGYERAHLLGLSMGGSVALTLAGLAPERVDSLVLCDTTAWYGADAPEAWRERAAQASSRPRHLQIAFQVERWFSEGFRRHHPEVVSLVSGIFLRTAPATHAAACRALGALDSRSLLEKITAPTLVICGREDFATPPAMAELLASRIASASLLLAPAKHFAILESPALRGAVRSHLAGDAVDPEAAFDPSCCEANRRGLAAA